MRLSIISDISYIINSTEVHVHRWVCGTGEGDKAKILRVTERIRAAASQAGRTLTVPSAYPSGQLTKPAPVTPMTPVYRRVTDLQEPRRRRRIVIIVCRLCSLCSAPSGVRGLICLAARGSGSNTSMFTWVHLGSRVLADQIACLDWLGTPRGSPTTRRGIS